MLCLTQGCDAIELGLVHQHVHVDGARLQLFAPQEVENGSKERRVPVDEDLQRKMGEFTNTHTHTSTTVVPRFTVRTAPVSSFRVEIRPLRRLRTKTKHPDVIKAQMEPEPSCRRVVLDLVRVLWDLTDLEKKESGTHVSVCLEVLNLKTQTPVTTRPQEQRAPD